MSLARRKSVRVLGVVLVVLLLAVVGVKIFLPAEKIRDLALAQAQTQLGREVSVGEVAVSLRGGLGVRLADFVIHNPDGFVGGNLLTTAAVDLKLELAPLLKGEVRVNRLVIDAPVVNLVRLADGSDNFTFVPADGAVPDDADDEGAASAAATDAPPPLSVATLTLRNGQITLTDATAPEGGLQRLEVAGVALSLSLTDPAPGRFQVAGRLTTDKIVMTGPEDIPELNSAVDFDLTWDTATSRLDIAEAAVEVNNVALTGSGYLVTAGKAPTGQIQFALQDVSLAELLAYLPPEQAAKVRADQDTGKVSATVDVALAADQTMRATGKLTVGGMTLVEPELPPLQAVVDYDVTWDAANSVLELTRIEAEVNDLPLTCSGRVVVAEELPTGQIAVQVSDLPLAEMATFLPPELGAKIPQKQESGRLSATVNLVLTGDEAVPVHSDGVVSLQDVDLSLAQPFLPPGQDGKLAGRADVEMTFVDKSGDPTQIVYQGTAKARGVSFTESGLVDELENLDAALKFTQDEFTVESCRARFASGTFDLTGSLRDPFPYFLPPEMQGDADIKTPHLSFALRSPRLDVDRLLPAASPTGAAPAGEKVAGARTVPVDLEFPDLTCDGTFTADSLIYMQVPLTDVTGKVTLRDRVLGVHEVTGAVYRGEIDGKVEIDLNDLNEPVYSGSYQARDIEVDNFVTRFAGMAGVVFGGCNMDGTFAARGLDPDAIRNSLTLDSNADIKEGKVVTSGSTFTALSNLASQAGQSFSHEQTLRDFVTQISVENGRVGLSEMTTRLGQFGDVTMDGYYGFNGDVSYNGTILLTKGQTDRLFSGGVLAELAKLLGSQRPARLALPLSVGGTRTNPKVKLDLSVVTGDLQKRAAREQGNKLEDAAKDKLGDLLKKWK